MICDESQVVAIPADFGRTLRGEKEVTEAKAAARQSSSGLVGRETHACFESSKEDRRRCGRLWRGTGAKPGCLRFLREEEDGALKYCGCGSSQGIDSQEALRW